VGVVFGKVDAAMDAAVVAPLRQLDIQMAQQRTPAMQNTEFMGLEFLYVGHLSGCSIDAGRAHRGSRATRR
jgi:hypothetical protein